MDPSDQGSGGGGSLFEQLGGIVTLAGGVLLNQQQRQDQLRSEQRKQEAEVQKYSLGNTRFAYGALAVAAAIGLIFLLRKKG